MAAPLTSSTFILGDDLGRRNWLEQADPSVFVPLGGVTPTLLFAFGYLCY